MNMEKTFSDVSKLPNIIDLATAEEEIPRAYIGASAIGEPCRRKLFLSFRQAIRTAVDGRLRRIFDMGRDGEARMTSYLLLSGLEIQHTGYDQIEIQIAPFIKAHPDGIILSGVPEAMKTRHIWECKTANDSSFKEIAKKGVKLAKPMHWCQMQVEMLALGIDRSLYTVINKNSCEIYAERIRLDREASANLIRRAISIAGWNAPRTPSPISEQPRSYYVCKTCQFREFCIGEPISIQKSCRTCHHSTPIAEEEGFFRCDFEGCGERIPEEIERKGCRHYETHPALKREEAQDGRA